MDQDQKPKFGLATICLILGIGALLLLWQTKGSDTKPVTTPTPTPMIKVAADAQSPSSSDCQKSAGDIAIILVEKSGLSPKCLIVSKGQHLNVLNDMEDTSGTVNFAGYTMQLDHEGAVDVPYQFGQYLAPGVHKVETTFFGGESAEIWFRP